LVPGSIAANFWLEFHGKIREFSAADVLYGTTFAL